MLSGELFPVFCGSGESAYGVRAVMNKLVELMPAPDAIGTIEATDGSDAPIEIEAVDGSEFTALVFKTTQEPRVGELTFFRVFSGTVDSGSTVNNPLHHRQERIAHLAVPDASQRSENRAVARRRHRRRREAQGYPYRRHVVQARPVDAPRRDRVAPAGQLDRDLCGVARRGRQARDRLVAPARRGSDVCGRVRPGARADDRARGSASCT